MKRSILILVVMCFITIIAKAQEPVKLDSTAKVEQVQPVKEVVKEPVQQELTPLMLLTRYWSNYVEMKKQPQKTPIYKKGRQKFDEKGNPIPPEIKGYKETVTEPDISEFLLLLEGAEQQRLKQENK